ncbi:MAG: Inner membrane protein [Chlamydiales bacterium]|nr:Inner membrane protein [Chlamydiales bacterium]MCH9636201.1 Inner membrane protein [Chlamydiales bacterium]MCH9703354.1 DedA family protein [Chlamydiota bacterium]
MEEFVFQHAHLAHWVIFGLFMLAGFNLPISEDILIIAGGILASTVVPENTWKIFAAIFLGAYLSDLVLFYLSRALGPSILSSRWFSKMVKPKRVRKMEQYYEKWGVLTLFFGRFIPFGVRNCLFVTAGMSRMNPSRFMLVDGVACFITNSSLFALSYFCGRSCSIWVKIFNVSLFSLFLIALFSFIWYKTASDRETAD